MALVAEQLTADLSMSGHTASGYSINSQEMRVPDVNQHVVHPPRSTTAGNPAGIDSSYYRHLDEYFNYELRSAADMNTHSLSRLAGNSIQAHYRPANEPEHGLLSVQSSTRQRALARSTAAGHVGNPRTPLQDQPSWHGGNPERLPSPCRDRVQSIPAELSVRHPIRPESTRLHPNVNARRGGVADYRHTVLAGHVDGMNPMDVNDRFGTDLGSLTGSLPAPISRLTDRSVLAEHASNRHTAASCHPYVPEIGQADHCRPVPTLATHGQAREQARDPTDHLLDQVSVHSLDIESEAQFARATLERGGGRERYGFHRPISTFSAYYPSGSASAEARAPSSPRCCRLSGV